MPQSAQDFDAWYRRSRARLLRLASSRVRDPDEAEDVVQDSVMAVWRKHLEGKIEDLDAYAARAVWLNAGKRAARRRTWTPLDGEAGPEPAAPAEPLDYEDRSTLAEARSALPEAQRAVLELRYDMGLSFREAAEALSISLNTAASRARYALEALRESLAHPKEEARHARPSDPAPDPASKPQLQRQQRRRHRRRA
jgi:RNA polymerase sigma-70 factor (ECF subfamily)